MKVRRIPLKLDVAISSEVLATLLAEHPKEEKYTPAQVITDLIEKIKFFVEYKMIPFALRGEINASIRGDNINQGLVTDDN